MQKWRNTITKVGHIFRNEQNEEEAFSDHDTMLDTSGKNVYSITDLDIYIKNIKNFCQNILEWVLLSLMYRS